VVIGVSLGARVFEGHHDTILPTGLGRSKCRRHTRFGSGRRSGLRRGCLGNGGLGSKGMLGSHARTRGRLTRLRGHRDLFGRRRRWIGLTGLGNPAVPQPIPRARNRLARPRTSRGSRRETWLR
jgi:hypothetical protein